MYLHTYIGRYIYRTPAFAASMSLIYPRGTQIPFGNGHKILASQVPSTLVFDEPCIHPSMRRGNAVRVSRGAGAGRLADVVGTGHWALGCDMCGGAIIDSHQTFLLCLGAISILDVDEGRL